MAEAGQSEPRPALLRTPSYLRMAPTRAAMSFENLVALANDQERLRDARKIIWRDRGDPIVHVDSLQEVFKHAAQGGTRAATLGFGIRAGVNVFLALFQAIRRPRKFRAAIILHVIFGHDCFRFAAMLGSFAGLYKLILNSLPILLPPSPTAKTVRNKAESPTEPLTPMVEFQSGRRRESLVKRSSQLSINAQYQRKQSKRWHAALAGFIAGGIAVSFEAKSRRLVIGQQMFVRGLQGTYNGFTKKRGIHVPYGAVWVFSLCCAQIMYAFLLRPDSIPPAYNNWIQQASRVQRPTISVNRGLVREGRFNPADLQDLVDWKRSTPSNRSSMQERLYRAQELDQFGARYGPCYLIHPWIDNCRNVPIDRFLSVFQWMLPIYGALHFIPMLLFKRKEVAHNPTTMLSKAALGTGRSSTFLATFVVIYQTYFCAKNNAFEALLGLRGHIPRWIIDICISKSSFWVGGFLAGLALFVEERRRRAELAMYVLPKALESAWKVARGKGYLPGSEATRKSGMGESLLTAIGMAMVMNTYQIDPQHLSGLVRRILYQFVGPN